MISSGASRPIAHVSSSSGHSFFRTLQKKVEKVVDKQFVYIPDYSGSKPANEYRHRSRKPVSMISDRVERTAGM